MTELFETQTMFDLWIHSSVEAFLTLHKGDDALPGATPFKNGVKETIVRDTAHYCASRENSLKLECTRRNHERKQQLRRRRRNRSQSWDKWQMVRSLEAHRRWDIIQSLYLLVFQRSHSRFNSRYVYCHSVVIFPLKFSLDNKKRANETLSVVGKL